MSCSDGGDPVKWTDIKTLSDAVDAATAELNEIGVVPLLRNSTEYPFRFADVIPYEDFVQFDLIESTTGWEVQRNYIVTTWDLPWALSDSAERTTFNTLVDDDDQGIYFVNDDEICWCKSQWRVRGSSAAGYRLANESDSSLGCCPTVEIPTEGTTLSKELPREENYFIPTAKLIALSRRLSAAPPAYHPKVFSVKRCVADTGHNCHIMAEYTSTGWKITRVLVKLSGYFTWKIAKKQFGALISTMQNQCSASCGSDGTIRKAGYSPSTDDSLLSVGCAVGIDDIIWTQHCASTYVGCPGTIKATGTDCGYLFTTKYPWEEVTNGGVVTCGLGVYRTVIDQLTGLIQKIHGLQPRDSDSGCPCPSCGITWTGFPKMCGACANLIVTASSGPNTGVQIAVSGNVSIACWHAYCIDIDMLPEIVRVNCFDPEANPSGVCEPYCDSAAVSVVNTPLMFGLITTQDDGCVASATVSCQSRTANPEDPNDCPLVYVEDGADEVCGTPEPCSPCPTLVNNGSIGHYANGCPFSLGTSTSYTIDFAARCCIAAADCVCADEEFPV